MFATNKHHLLIVGSLLEAPPSPPVSGATSCCSASSSSSSRLLMKSLLVLLLAIGLAGMAQTMQDFNNDQLKRIKSQANGPAANVGLKSVSSNEQSRPMVSDRRSFNSEVTPTGNHRSEISLRQVLVPLLNAGHLNRIYYAKQGPTQLQTTTSKLERQLEHHSSRLLSYSPNNRGPTQPSDARPSQLGRHLLESRLRFGERRALKRPAKSREDTISFRVPSLMAREDAPNSQIMSNVSRQTIWSQPDPRKSYSLPVALVKVSSAKRAASRRSLATIGRGTHSSPVSTRRDEFDSSLAGEQASFPSETSSTSTPTTSTTTTTTTAAAQTYASRVRFPSNETDSDMGASSTSSSFDDQSEIVFADVSKRPARTEAATSSQLEMQKPGGSMVTLIRYLPVIMSVPADQLSALVAPSVATAVTPSTLAGSKLSPPPRVELVGHQHPVAYSQEPLASASATTMLKPSKQTLLAKYQLIEPITLATNQRPHQLAEEGPTPQMALAAGDISSDYSQLYPLTSGATIGLQTGAATFGDHQSLPATSGRIAYIQAPQSGGSFATTHMTSKALQAYASKLIAMLRPSSLFSSIGAGANAQLANLGHSFNNHHNHHHNNQAHQHQPAQIILLAPTSEAVSAHSLMSGGGGLVKANQILAPGLQPPSQSQSQTGRPAAAVASQLPRAEDLLLNQASKVHSTKSNRQQPQQQQQQTNDYKQAQPQQQVRLPMAPQMNGLICIQGMVGNKQQPQQQQQTVSVSQNQMQEEELGSFDYEPRPVTKSEPQSGTKTSQSAPTTKMPPPGNQSYQSGRGPVQRPSKESPIRMMQKIASKTTNGQDSEPAKYTQKQEQTQQQQQQQQEEQQDIGQMSQQKLMGSPSESRSVFESEREASPTSSSSSSLAASANQLQPATTISSLAVASDELSTDRRSIIPFTIRDKIDAPKGGRQAQAKNRNNNNNQRVANQLVATATNGPVQYDEPAETEQPAALGSGSGSESERRSRTSFVSTAASNSNRKPPNQKWRSQAAPANEIDYKKESASQREFSLPILMASSTSSSSASASSSVSRAQQSRNTDEPSIDSHLNYERNSHQRSPFSRNGPSSSSRSPVPPRVSDGPELGSRHSMASSSVSSHELMGLPSSASSISTSTPATNNSGPDSPNGPSQANNRQQQHQTTSTNQTEDGPLGRLISSISLTGDLEHTTSSPSWPTATTTTSSSSVRPPNDTVELVFNSTPRDPKRTSTGDDVGSDSEIITASPMTGFQLRTTNNTSTTPAPLSTSGTGTERRQATDEDTNGSEAVTQMASDQLEQSDSTNAFSHDRTLTLSANSNQFGRISESLQTNPLDLIDLQNSRSRFELPDQLESLSMLKPNERWWQRQRRRRRNDRS